MRKIISAVMMICAIGLQGCVTVASKSAYIEYPQKIKVRVQGDVTELKTYALEPDTTEGTRKGSRYLKYSGYIHNALKNNGYNLYSGSMPDQMIYFHYSIGDKDFDVSTPVNTNCRRTYGDEINCRTTGGNNSHTLVSIFLKLTAFDVRGWKAGKKNKFAWELKTVLHQVDPRSGPDTIIMNMIENISPYLGKDTQGEVEIEYP